MSCVLATQWLTFALEYYQFVTRSTIKSKLIYDSKFDLDMSKQYSKLNLSNSFQLKKDSDE